MKDQTSPPISAPPGTGPEEDRAAVDAVIVAEIEAFFTCDFDRWAACYLHSDRLRSTMMSHELGLDVREGWDAHVAGTRLHFEAGPIPGARWEKVTDQIIVSGDMAWLTCRARSDSRLCHMGESYETWVLERHEGAWRIVCVNVMAARSMQNADQRIAVDAAGRVIGLGPRAERALAAHPALTLRDGRLRARDRQLDTELQAAIARAGELHGYFEQARFAEIEGQRFAWPLVLETGADGTHEIVMLTVQDQLTYVDLGGPGALRTRVDVSATIFGLSEAQHRVAQGVVAGQSLPEIATEMAIAPATARTHLQRVYAKTGTSTMTALVRILLSAG